MKMITRFSLYGFLKNFDFSEPFLILFYLSLGLSYFQIGILAAFLNICINLMEIPSGAFADLYGRKTSMLLSLTSYLVAFAIFALTQSFAPLFLAVFFFAFGDAFRTGTHKAIIFDWLKINNRLEEKTKIYGYTRSWSKYGSAISVVVATIIMLIAKDYRWVFVLSMIPGALGLVNIWHYPNELNRKQKGNFSLQQIAHHTGSGIQKAFGNKNIRLFIVQGLGFDGSFDVAKDYLQPVLQTQAVVLAAFFAVQEVQGTAVTVGIVYFILHMISGIASRNAHRFASLFASEKTALIILLWAAAALTFASSFGLVFGFIAVSIIAYLIFYVAQNLWTPILVAQYDDFAESSEQATILSIASQTKSVAVIFLAPLAGAIADRFGIQASLFLIALLLSGVGIYSSIARKR